MPHFLYIRSHSYHYQSNIDLNYSLCLSSSLVLHIDDLSKYHMYHNCLSFYIQMHKCQMMYSTHHCYNGNLLYNQVYKLLKNCFYNYNLK